MIKNKVLVTAALPYSNGDLHLGHIAGAYLPSDIFVRFLKMRGHDVRFICGSDDHGVAIMLTAQKMGKTPREIAEHFNKSQKKDFEDLNIIFDTYGSTSGNPYHAETSQDFFLSIYKQGFFSKETTEQFYDESRQMFLPDRFVKGECGYCGAKNQNGDQCEDCGKMLDAEHFKNPVSAFSGEPATIKESTHWFLDLSKFEGVVGRWLESSMERDTTKSYVKGLLSTGLVKRSMTRDLTWGVPVPLDDPDAKGKVLYVWFDAPIGYISNTIELCNNRGESSTEYQKWWNSDETDIFHFIGEDNTIFHCVIWIAMLHITGKYHLPRGVIVNNFLNVQKSDGDIEKMSKSRGTLIPVAELIKDGIPADVARYYLTAIAPEKARTAFSYEDMIQKNNADLANTLGNFINRILSFTKKNVGDEVPAIDQSKVTEVDKEFRQNLETTFNAVTEQLNNCEFKSSLETIMEFARSCNRYVDTQAPWTTKKTDTEVTKVTLSYAINAIYALSIMLYPFIPSSCEKIWKMLCITETPKWEDALKTIHAGHKIGETEILFSKLET